MGGPEHLRGRAFRVLHGRPDAAVNARHARIGREDWTFDYNADLVQQIEGLDFDIEPFQQEDILANAIPPAEIRRNTAS